MTYADASEPMPTQPLMKTCVAVLGTLAEFHREPIPYDLPALVRLVTELHPDLLCLDMTSEQWERRDFGELPPEYRDALLPLAHQTDMVVVPIADERSPQETTAPQWRGKAIAKLRQWLGILHRQAPGPEAVNGGWRHFVADLLYKIIDLLAGPIAQHNWQIHTNHLIRQVVAVARRDPGSRVLVVLNVRHCHIVRRELRHVAEIRVMNYSQLKEGIG